MHKPSFWTSAHALSTLSLFISDSISYSDHPTKTKINENVNETLIITDGALLKLN